MLIAGIISRPQDERPIFASTYFDLRFGGLRLLFDFLVKQFTKPIRFIAAAKYQAAILISSLGVLNTFS